MKKYYDAINNNYSNITPTKKDILQELAEEGYQYASHKNYNAERMAKSVEYLDKIAREGYLYARLY